jgi:4-hydroxy-3-methylbut-2-enyl diphosphate reductase
MEVKLARKRGFCFGVEDAIELAERTLDANEAGRVVALGPVIHNRQVVERLEEAGLNQSAKIDEVDPDTTVLIRSHGAPPETFAKAREHKISLVDATCVLVKRVQQLAEQLEADGYEVVIIGEESHPEVQGLMGCVHDVVVVADESDLRKLPPNGRLGIVCQTTQSPEHLGRMLGAIGRGSFRELKVINTLCKEAIKRQESAVELCKQVDVMFVLGGLHSANTRRLADLCKKHNPATFHLQNWDELDKNTIFGKNVAGVTAGASTPNWIIDDFVKHLKAFDEEQ